MAISSALGTGSLTPGVCTSSTRPTSPFEGQMIYETDTNRVLIWDNAAWVMIADTDQPPGLQLIKAETFTSQPAVQINNCFDVSLYKSYYISFRINTSSASDVFYRFVNGTTPISTSSYVWNRHYGYSSAGAGTGYTYGDLLTYSYFTTSLAWGCGGSANIRLGRIGTPDTVSLNAQSTTGNNGTPYGFRNDVGSGCITSLEINGLYLSSLGAATISGDVEIYGYRK